MQRRFWFYEYFFSDFKKNRQQSKIMGKMTEQRIPYCRSPPKTAAMSPATEGPEEHPRSPDSASRANMVVPPNLTLSVARENVPGQKMPTEKPQMIHPMSARTGSGERPMMR